MARKPPRYKEHTKGDDLAFRYAFTSGGAALDVSGWTFSGHMRTNPADADEIGVFTFDTSDAATGIVIARADRDALESGYLVHCHMQAVTESNFRVTFDRVVVALTRDGTR